MALLMMDDEDDARKHFNYKKIVEQQNLSKKKKKLLMKKKELLEDDFQVMVYSWFWGSARASLTLVIPIIFRTNLVVSYPPPLLYLKDKNLDLPF